MGINNSVRVLVVDDNVILLRSIKEMLGENYAVGIAASGAQAFTSIEKNKPDIILLDYEMPDVNGEEVFNKLRSDSSTSDIPVVFFTAGTDPDVITKLTELSSDGYILKHPNKETIIEKIETTLSLHA